MPKRTEPLPHSNRRRIPWLELCTFVAVNLLIVMCLFTAMNIIEGQAWFTRDANWQRIRTLNDQDAERLRQEREQMEREYAQPTFTLTPAYTPVSVPDR